MPSTSILRRLAFGLVAATLAFGPAAALEDSDRPAVEQIVRDYLLKNPEVIQEAIAELQRRQEVAESTQRKQAMAGLKPLIFDSPRGVVVGNPKGDVTLVEFFDYNCGYCKRALSDLTDLMKADPKLKVVLKEFPVLGQGSVEAAQVAVAVRLVAPDKYLAFHHKLLSDRGQANKARALAAAGEVGIDAAKLEKAMADPEVRATLEESFKIADALGINGTPSYIAGEEVVIGAVGVDKLRSTIDSIRACGKAQC
ncbi:MAG TPA: DsbA family protein [Xanthobacteraceae bacterium]|nr:DsbA family protein [Xanthobacteraceae bacterium]